MRSGNFYDRLFYLQIIQQNISVFKFLTLTGLALTI